MMKVIVNLTPDMERLLHRVNDGESVSVDNFTSKELATLVVLRRLGLITRPSHQGQWGQATKRKRSTA